MFGLHRWWASEVAGHGLVTILNASVTSIVSEHDDQVVRGLAWVIGVAIAFGAIALGITGSLDEGGATSCCPAASSEAASFNWGVGLPVGLSVGAVVLAIGVYLVMHYRVR
jgi:hypothetical protein